MKTVIAAFSDRAAADQAIRELSSLNVQERDIETLEGTDANHVPRLLAKNVPQDRAHLYAEVLRRGASVVIIDVDDNNAQRVATMLDERGSLDLDSAASRWRTAGWQGYREGAQPFDESRAASERLDLERESFVVIEEEVTVGTAEAEGEAVRVRAFVTEHPVEQTVELREERLEVKREAADEPIAPELATFTEEEYVVTATSEVPVVEKQARVETIEETERRRDVEVEVEKLDPRGPRR